MKQELKSVRLTKEEWQLIKKEFGTFTTFVRMMLIKLKKEQ